jgi:hypothetical protein
MVKSLYGVSFAETISLMGRYGTWKAWPCLSRIDKTVVGVVGPSAPR